MIMCTMSSLANAQSSVTTYGVLDIGPVYRTNVNAAGNHTFSLGDSSTIGDAGNGALSGSRIGFKGVEDLGDGSSAFFQLENGFTLNSGAIAQQGQLFGRQAFVGLQNQDWGKISLGRQYGLGTNLLFDHDPLGWGNFTANEWEAYLMGVRFDNSVRYGKAFGAFGLDIQYSFGGQAGDTSIGKTAGADLTYKADGLKLAGFVQQSTDANSRDATSAGIDFNYTIGANTIIANYLNASFDAGFSKAASNSGLALANTSFIGNGSNTKKRTDHLFVIGDRYGFTPATALTIGYMLDNITNASSAGDGRLSTTYVLLDHYLSKRTDVYAEIDYSTASGQANVTGATLNGIGNGVPGTSSNSLGVAFGVRLRF